MKEGAENYTSSKKGTSEFQEKPPVLYRALRNMNFVNFYVPGSGSMGTI
jgi:hypothetical protein